MNPQRKADRNIKNLKKDVSDMPLLRLENATYKEHLANAVETISHQKDLIENLTKEKDQLHGFLQERHDAEMALQGEIDQTKRLAEKDISSLQTRIETLEKEAEAFSMSALRRKLQELKDENDKLYKNGTPALQSAQERIKSLQNELFDAKQALHVAAVKIAKMEKALGVPEPVQAA